jgi:hypothetical protein
VNISQLKLRSEKFDDDDDDDNNNNNNTITMIKTTTIIIIHGYIPNTIQYFI